MRLLPLLLISCSIAGPAMAQLPFGGDVVCANGTAGVEVVRPDGSHFPWVPRPTNVDALVSADTADGVTYFFAGFNNTTGAESITVHNETAGTTQTFPVANFLQGTQIADVAPGPSGTAAWLRRDLNDFSYRIEIFDPGSGQSTPLSQDFPGFPGALSQADSNFYVLQIGAISSEVRVIDKNSGSLVTTIPAPAADVFDIDVNRVNGTINVDTLVFDGTSEVVGRAVLDATSLVVLGGSTFGRLPPGVVGLGVATHLPGATPAGYLSAQENSSPSFAGSGVYTFDLTQNSPAAPIANGLPFAGIHKCDIEPTGTPPEIEIIHLEPGQGVSFQQIGFTYPGAPVPNSRYGQVTIHFNDLPPVGTGDRYLNVLSDGGDWRVQNVPVIAQSDQGGVSTLFDLGTNGPIETLLLDLQLSDDPLALPALGPTLEFAPQGGLPIVVQNTQGEGSDTISTPPPPPAGPLAFAPGPTEIIFQPNHGQSIEQDTNQCAPAAYANSFQYLENRFGIDVPHNNVPGISTDEPGALVREIDIRVPRAPGQTVAPTAGIEAKLDYMADNGLSALIMKHRGVPNADVTMSGLTSTHQGDMDVEALLQELRDDEDVEIGILWDGGGGHCAEVIAGGRILGKPFLIISHDASQGAAGGTTVATGGQRFTWLEDTDDDGTPNFHNGASQGEIYRFVSQSVPTQTCGDGLVQDPETCETPGSLCFGLIDESVCRGSAGGAPPACTCCGDGVVNDGTIEFCDDGNLLDDDQCDTAGLAPNALAPCTFTSCGDGTQQALNGAGEVEICDDGNLDPLDFCDVNGVNPVSNGSCTLTFCGDGAVQPLNGVGVLEFCDDGNLDPVDQCDVIGANPQTVGACTLTFCGDGTVQDPNGSGLAEQCEDGNASFADACDTLGANANGNGKCSLTFCGDQQVQSPNGAGQIEGCDDGNASAFDTCDVAGANPKTNGPCTPTFCGDGAVQFPNAAGDAEDCDDGNANPADQCDTQGANPNTGGRCSFTFCNDGTVQQPNAIGLVELCDDANPNGADTCDTLGTNPKTGGACTPTFCGDGTVQAPNGAGLVEACDDGNATNGDGCSATCQVEIGLGCICEVTKLSVPGTVRLRNTSAVGAQTGGSENTKTITVGVTLGDAPGSVCPVGTTALDVPISLLVTDLGGDPVDLLAAQPASLTVGSVTHVKFDVTYTPEACDGETATDGVDEGPVPKDQGGVNEVNEPGIGYAVPCGGVPVAASDLICKPSRSTSACRNGVDDDGDTLIDGADPQCADAHDDDEAL